MSEVQHQLLVSPWSVEEGDLVLIAGRYRPFYARYEDNSTGDHLAILMTDEDNGFRARRYPKGTMARIRRSAPVGVCPHCGESLLGVRR